MSEEQSDYTIASETVAGEVEPELPRGSQIDRYVVLDCLGRGGMGVVYRAYDPQLDRSIALKLIKRVKQPRGETAADGSNRLLREAKALAQLNHPHVVAVHDVGTVGDEVFVAMEFVAGKWFSTSSCMGNARLVDGLSRNGSKKSVPAEFNLRPNTHVSPIGCMG